MSADIRNELRRIIKQQRVMRGLGLHELAAAAGVSASHLGRIERGERFPSARILRKIAQPLGFGVSELFTLADYLPSEPSAVAESEAQPRGLDPYVSTVLSEKPVEVQRAVITILTVLKSIAKGTAQ